MGNYKITGSQIAGDHNVMIGELHIEELHLHLACDPQERRKDMEEQSLKEAKRRILEAAEAVCGTPKSMFDYLTDMEVAVRKLDGLLDLLGACHMQDAGEVNLEHVAEAMQTFTGELGEINRWLYAHRHDDLERIKAVADEFLREHKEASPTATKQEGEAPKD